MCNPVEVLEFSGLTPATNAAPKLLDAYSRGYRLHSMVARGDNIVFALEHQQFRAPSRRLPRPGLRPKPPIDNREMLNAMGRL